MNERMNNPLFHSFFFNASPVCIIVALKPIRRGEQICIAYSYQGEWLKQHAVGYTELLGTDQFPSKLDLPPLPATTTDTNTTNTNGDNINSSSNNNNTGNDGPSFVCARCGKIDNNLSSCGKCSLFKYCCRQCQLDDWPSHKSICNNIKLLSSSTSK